MNVTIYAGIAGDRNERGMAGAVSLGKRMAAELGLEPSILGSPAASGGGWSVQLQAASSGPHILSAAVAALLEAENVRS